MSATTKILVTVIGSVVLTAGWIRAAARAPGPVDTRGEPEVRDGLLFPAHRQVRDRAIGAVVARFVHTEEVTGSNPVSPTDIEQPPNCSHARFGGCFVLELRPICIRCLARDQLIRRRDWPRTRLCVRSPPLTYWIGVRAPDFYAGPRTRVFAAQAYVWQREAPFGVDNPASTPDETRVLPRRVHGS
jgi:hypothetical protein